jgi:ABC-type lipoprotein export system ATPase subunit
MEIMEIFRQLHAEGNTIVVITHERDIAACCKRILVIRDGLIISDSPNLN